VGRSGRYKKAKGGKNSRAQKELREPGRTTVSNKRGRGPRGDGTEVRKTVWAGKIGVSEHEGVYNRRRRTRKG